VPTRRAISELFGLRTFLLALALVACLVPETLASGELRPQRAPSLARHLDPPLQDWAEPRDEVYVRHLVAPDETFVEILRGHGLPEAAVLAWYHAAGHAYDLDRIEPGHALLLTFAKDRGHLIECAYEIDRYSMLSMRLLNGQIRAHLKAMPHLAAVRGVMGRVEASLATSASAAGVPVRMLSELAELFGWDLDLQDDVRPGDEFRILYAEVHDEQEGPRPGDILAAEIVTRGRTLTAIRFEDDEGKPEYYDLDGRALGRPFLRYPVAFRRVSSGFSGSRLHPVLKRRRPHRGVDFSASIGTPVRTVADGVITFAGWNGQYGQQVGIQHEDPYATSYSHLRGVAPGIRVGSRVEKGQVIGFVGRSGMATGPHLHYMMFKDGNYVNPFSAIGPLADEQLSGARQRRFAHLRDEMTERLAGLAPPIDSVVRMLAPRSVVSLVRSNVASYVN
jgi:murein DD-endopeptidase MepM/ murein hydrolase activator NlpD